MSSMTKAEKIREIAKMAQDWRYGTVEEFCARSVLSARSVMALLRHKVNVDAVSEILGAKVVYTRGSYYASGNGAFGHLGSGRRGQRNKPTITIGQ